MLTAAQVLKVIAEHPHAMGTLDGGPCAIQHVSRRNADGPDERLDACPCSRKATGPDLGDGQYISSETHTVADLVRDTLGAT